MRNIGRVRLFGLSVMIVLVMGLLSSTASADTVLYQTGFDNNASTTPGDLVDGLNVDGTTWVTSGTGDYRIGDAGTNLGGNPAKGFDLATASVGCLYPKYTDVSGKDSRPQVEFNTDSSVGNEIVRVDFYMMPADGTSSAGYIAAGLYQPGTTVREAVVFMKELDHTVRIAYGATGHISTFTYVTYKWYHVALELNYNTSKVKLYAKQVNSGDTSALTESDLVTFNSGADTEVDFTPDAGKAYASKFGVYHHSGYGTGGAYDNLEITAIPIIPKGTLIIIQ